MKKLLAKAKKEHILTQGELTQILAYPSGSLLYAAADEIRRQFVGDEVHLRGLIEFSNYCKQNCLYCGLRRENKKIARYRMEVDEILAAAARAKEAGYETIVLQSGEDDSYSTEKIVAIIKGIKALGVALTLSLGEKSYDEYEAYRQAGANRYLLRIETTDKKLYEDLDPCMSWANRLKCLEDLKVLGYEVGSGVLVGLPSQTLESLARDILFLKNFPVHMAGIGPFIANPDTPLAAYNKEGKNNLELALKVMTLTRLLMPSINIPATTAMEALSPGGRFRALQAGANVIMPNVSDENYRRLYKLYPGKPLPLEDIKTYRANLEIKLKKIGRSIGLGHGASKAFLSGN
ncbi:MAG: [FeFe] hydrogenase H-cluster radical SAM maturase HydE [Elusimicrobiota bacterium]|nr:[FeFe] hydrogenase H-cluster radical SAM maturase HydE [Elusimicrobiota bacterium]